MGRSVAVVCPKGGVGKTTVSVNLAAALADKGFSCLVIGVDPQCGVLGSFGRERFSVDFGLLDFFDPDGRPELAVQPSGVDNLDFITSNVWSRDEEEQLLTWAAIAPESLDDQVRSLKSSYDFIILDCPPNLGPLTYAALQASDLLVVPLQAEELAFQALPRLFDALEDLRGLGGDVPELAGILLNQVDLRTRMANSVLERVRGDYEGKVYETLIPRSIRLAEVAQRGRPVSRFNAAGQAARAFAALADEFLAGLPNMPRETAPEPRAETVKQEEPATAPQPVLTATGEILLDHGAGSEEPPIGEPDDVISLDEAEEQEGASCRVTRPNLDDYEGSAEDGWH